MNLLTRISSNLRQILADQTAGVEPQQQFAALCYRVDADTSALEVLVATSRDTGRWVIPKGWPMKGKKPHEVAAQEAFEEVGVRGKVEKRPLGVYHYDKRMSDLSRVPVSAQVHALHVKTCLKNFPEKGSRQIEWVSCGEAARRVREPELKSLFLAFEDRMSGSRGHAAE